MPPDDSSASTDPLVSTSLRTWLAASAGALRRSLLPLVVVQLLVLLPVAVLVLALGGDGLFVSDRVELRRFGFFYGVQDDLPAVTVVATLLGVLGAAASVFIVVRDAAGRAWNVGELLRFTGHRAPRLLLYALGASVLVGLGLVLLVIPGLVLAVVFTGALLGALVVERGGFRRVFRLAGNEFGRTLGRVLVLIVVVALGGLVALVPGLLVGWGAYPGEPRQLVAQLLANLATVPVAAFALCAVVVLYAELRARREPGTDVRVLADDLDRRGLPPTRDDTARSNPGRGTRHPRE